PPHAFFQIAVIARFSPAGVIDARNGDAYAADAPLPYVAFTTYQFRFVVDVGAGRYDVFVRPEGGEEVAVARDYEFRTEQSDAVSLNRFSSFAAVGENRICEVLEDEPGYPDADSNGEPDVGSDSDVYAGGDDAGEIPGPDSGPAEIVPDAGIGDASGEAPGQIEVESGGCGCSSAPGSPADGLVIVALFGAWVIRRRVHSRY
ncbi:MAG: MYXO-CTERM sorting domain-containing protein, partial [Bradymonadaceae bacterium]